MYGAILGDIIGSRFEFDRGGKTKDFELLTVEDNFTDDSVMTVAVAEALMDAGKEASVKEIEAACIRAMQRWGSLYPHAGYGGRFRIWLKDNDPKPYGSFGNGSAMRVSAAGWLYDSLERTREVARATANVTHNHPEGLKGAECTAAVIYMARNGASKEEIADYVVKEFGYDFSESLEEMRKRHEHVESCQDSLPKALRSFMDGISYEDVVRNAVSLGGDTDTLAAIAGAMAEAFFGIPASLTAECLLRINPDMREVVERFDAAIGRVDEDEDEEYDENRPLVETLQNLMAEQDKEKRVDAYLAFLNALAKRATDGGRVPVPFEDVNNALSGNFDPDQVQPGDTIRTEAQVKLKMDTMRDPEGNLWLPLFTDMDELHKGQTANVIMPVYIYDVLEFGLNGEDLSGVVVNPFDKPFTMTKEMLKSFLEDYKAWAEKMGIKIPTSFEG